MSDVKRYYNYRIGFKEVFKGELKRDILKRNFSLLSIVYASIEDAKSNIELLHASDKDNGTTYEYIIIDEWDKDWNN